MLGESVLFMPSNALWAAKRKSLSQLWYKDKLRKMEEIIVVRTLMYLTKWSEEFRGKPMSVMKETSLIVSDCINACVFGLKHCEYELLYEEEDGTYR